MSETPNSNGPADLLIVGGGSRRRVVPSVALNPTTIMIAERIAKAAYSS